MELKVVLTKEEKEQLKIVFVLKGYGSKNLEEFKEKLKNNERIRQEKNL